MDQPESAVSGAPPRTPPLNARLLVHQPGVVTAISIPEQAVLGLVGGTGFLEFSYKEILSALIPASAADATRPGPATVGGSTELPVLPSAAPALPPAPRESGRSRYSNIIEQLERKYCGSRTAAVVDDEEEEEEPRPKKKRRRKRKAGEQAAAESEGSRSDSDGHSDFYDSEDSFIDDSAAGRDIQAAYNMKKVHTTRSGFFVSAGELEVDAPPPSAGGYASEEGSADGGRAQAVKAPALSSQSALSTVRKAIRRRMVQLAPGRFPSEVAADIAKAVQICRRNSDYRWAIRELAAILQPTRLSTARIKKHVEEATAATAAKSVDSRKKKFDGKMKTAAEAIKTLLKSKLELFLEENKEGPDVTFIRRALVAAKDGADQTRPSDDVQVSVDARADAYLNVWVAVWADEELLCSLRKLEDVCKGWAKRLAEERISNEALAKSAASADAGSQSQEGVAPCAPEGGAAPPASVAPPGPASLPAPPVVDLSKSSGDGSQSQSQPSPPPAPLDEGAREGLISRAKNIFSHQLRKWFLEMSAFGVSIIRSYCAGLAGPAAASTGAATEDDDKAVEEKFLSHLKKIHKKRNMDWAPSARPVKKVQTEQVGNESANKQTNLNRDVAIPDESKKKVPKKKVVLPLDPSIVVPPVMQRTPSGMPSPSAAPSSSGGASGGAVANRPDGTNRRHGTSQRMEPMQRPVLSSNFATPPAFDFADFDK